VAERLTGIDGCELCADERPETIAAALERVLRRGQRVAGRIAVAHLAEEAITARLIGLYQSVLRRPPTGAPASVGVVAAAATPPER
jgi:hypothetical protein